MDISQTLVIGTQQPTFSRRIMLPQVPNPRMDEAAVFHSKELYTYGLRFSALSLLAGLSKGNFVRSSLASATNRVSSQSAISKSYKLNLWPTSWIKDYCESYGRNQNIVNLSDILLINVLLFHYHLFILMDMVLLFVFSSRILLNR